MPNHKYDLSKIYEATRDGLDILLHYYPKAGDVGRFINFKIREENNASARIFKPTDSDCYVIKDFGGKSYNPISLVCEEENLGFYDALVFLYKLFNIQGLTIQFSKATYKDKIADADANINNHTFDYKKELTDFELKNIGPFVTQQHCEDFKLHTVNKYSRIKQFKPGTRKFEQYGEKLVEQTTVSSESYPVYVFKHKDWQKIYKPLNEDARFRFSYAGTKPKNHIFGLDLVKKEIDRLAKKYEKDCSEAVKEKLSLPSKEKYKIDKVIIASGDRDGLNLYSLGYFVIWLNSETAKLPYDTYKFLKENIHNLYYCGDIDQVGFIETKQIAKQYTDIKIIRLPQWLKNYTYRGKGKKDVKDFVDILNDKLKNKNESFDYVSSSFKKLVDSALPYQFWFSKYDNKGNFKGWDIDNIAMIQFLEFNGFYKYADEFSKEDYEYIKFSNGTNIIQSVKKEDIEGFPEQYLKEIYAPKSLINFVIRSTHVKITKLKSLPVLETNIQTYGWDFQRFYFRNTIIKVSKDKIIKEKYDERNDFHVFENQILEKDIHFNPKKPPFKIEYDEETQKHTFTKIDENNDYFNFIINTCRIHWRKSHEEHFEDAITKIENEPHLTQKQKKLQIDKVVKDQTEYRVKNKFKITEEALPFICNEEQKQALLNRIFSNGYLLHQHKVMSRAWLVYAMDYRISENNDSNGGSGKSLVFHKMYKQLFKNIKTINGRDKEQIKDKFMLSDVTKFTSLICVEDADKSFPFEIVYNAVTDQISIRVMQKGYVDIPFEDASKFVITTNFALYEQGSSNRRVLFNIFSDYYHDVTDIDAEKYTPKNDFSTDFFSDTWSNEQYSKFYEYCFYSLQFYLNTETKIEAPNENVRKRNAMQKIGHYDGFFDWASLYFFPKDGNLDCYISKSDIYNHFKEKSGNNKMKAGPFKTKLKEYCKFAGFKFNPKGCKSLQADGRIIKSIDGDTYEFVYIKQSTVPLTNFWQVPKQLDSVYTQLDFSDPKPELETDEENQIKPKDEGFTAPDPNDSSFGYDDEDIVNDI